MQGIDTCLFARPLISALCCWLVCTLMYYIPTRGDICTMQELLDTRRTELVPGCTKHTWLGTRLIILPVAKG